MNAQVTLTDVSEVRKDLTFEIAAEEVKAEFEKTYNAYAWQAPVPGFRPGKAPRSMLKQRFGKEIEEQVFSRLLSHALQHALSDHQLNMIGEPDVTDLKYEEGAPLSFKVSLEILPSFELQEYKGLKATKRVQIVAEENVETVINQWRERMSKLVKVEDRPSQAGDTVTVNLVGKYLVAEGAEPEEDLKADDMQIELGAEGVQAEFNEHLTGVKEGEFRIRTSKPNVTVFWEVRATRNDLWMRAHPHPSEVDKPEGERGLVQHPELMGLSPDHGLNYQEVQQSRLVRNRPRPQTPVCD